MKREKYVKHSLVFVIAVIIGLIYLLPNIVYLNADNRYNPLTIQINNNHLDEALYAAGVMEVLEGNFIPADLSVYEHKKDPQFFYPPLPFIIMGTLAAVVGGIHNALIISSFVFSVIIFLLFYYLSKLFLKNKYASIASSLTLLFFYRLFIPPPSISLSSIFNHLTAVLLNAGQKPAYLWFSRFVQPQASIIFYFLTIIAFYIAVKRNKIAYYVLAGLMFALTIYSYFYYWTYLLIFLSLMSLVFLSKKDYKKFLGTLTSISSGLFLGIPYFMNLLLVRSFDIAARSGIETGRFIETISVVYLVLYGLFFVVCKRRDQDFYVFSSLYLAGVIILNIQIVLGFTIQNNHWNSRAIVPILILFSFYFLKELSAKLKLPTELKHYSKPILSVVVLIILLLAINIQVQDIKKLKRTNNFSDAEYELLQWLTKNTPPGSVILTSNLTWNVWIPAYTHDNVYFPYSAATLSSDEELAERFILTYKFFNVSSEYVEEKLLANSAFERIASHSEDAIDDAFDSYLKSFILLDRPFPIEHGILKQRSYNRSLVIGLFEEYQKHPFNREDIRKYKVDYILLTDFDKKFIKTRIGEYPFERVVFQNEDYALLKVKKT